jgi:hypothetical protein
MQRVIIYVGIVLLLGMVLVLPWLLIPEPSLAKETINADAVVDVTSLKFQDVNGNKQPDPGEFGIVLGKLYAPGTKTEIGTYRCSFVWGGWANSTDGLSVTPAVQIFDVKGKGTIVVVGDEPTTDSIGKAITGAIAGGTGAFTGVTGTATLTMKPIEGTNWPGAGVLEIERPAAAVAGLQGDVRTVMGIAIASLVVAVVAVVLGIAVAVRSRKGTA